MPPPRDEGGNPPLARPDPCGCHAEAGPSDGLAAVCTQRRTAPLGDPAKVRRVLYHVNESEHQLTLAPFQLRHLPATIFLLREIGRRGNFPREFSLGQSHSRRKWDRMVQNGTEKQCAQFITRLPYTLSRVFLIVPRNPSGKLSAALPDYPNSGGLGDESPNVAPVPEN